MTKTNDLLDAALAYAAAGFAVFPLVAGDKKPDGHLAPHAFKDATTDPVRIRRWWTTSPAANIGLPIPEGYVVVDVDTKDPDYFPNLPGHAMVSDTPRGVHFWYTTVVPVRPAVAVQPHVDIRAVGSYVVAPPSRLANGGQYTWRDGFKPAEAGEAPPWVTERRSVLKDRDPEEPMGHRSELIALAGTLRSNGASPEAVYTALAAMLNAGQIVSLDESNPWTAQHLKQIAVEAGKWKKGEPMVVPPIVATIAETNVSSDNDPPWSTALEDIEELEPEPLLLGRLDPADHTILFGDGGSGKSLVAASWVAELSHTRGVLIVDYEQHARYEWRPRVRQMGGRLDRVRVVQPDDAIWKHAGAIAAECEQFGLTYVVVDSVGYATGDLETEKSSTAVKYSKALTTIGHPALSLAHTTKTDTDPRYPFGSKYWHNGARITMSLLGHDYEPRVLTQKKTNHRSLLAPVQADWSWSETAGPGEVPAKLEWTEAGVTIRDRLLAVMAPGVDYAAEELVEMLNDDGGKETTRDGVNGSLRGKTSPFEKVMDGHLARWRLPKIDIKLGHNE